MRILYQTWTLMVFTTVYIIDFPCYAELNQSGATAGSLVPDDTTNTTLPQPTTQPTPSTPLSTSSELLSTTNSTTTTSTLMLASSPQDNSTTEQTTTRPASPGKTVLKIEQSVGETLDLSCPLPKSLDREAGTIRWYKIGNQGKRLVTEGTQMEDGLLIKGLVFDHSGIYSCVLKDSTGKETVVLEIRVIINQNNKKADSGADDDGKPPRFIGLAIGMGVCAALFLVSGAAVFLLNIRRGDSILRLRTMAAWSRRKEDEEAFSRLPGQGRPPRVSIIPIDRILRQSSAANQNNSNS